MGHRTALSFGLLLVLDSCDTTALPQHEPRASSSTRTLDAATGEATLQGAHDAAEPTSALPVSDVYYLEDSFTSDPPAFRFQGSIAGRFHATGSETPASDPRTAELVVTLDDGRVARSRFVLDEAYERVVPVGITPVVGSTDAFVLLVGEARGEDCFEIRVVAYLLEVGATDLRLVRRRPVAVERIAFDACGDAFQVTFTAEGDTIRAVRTTRRIRYGNDDAWIGLCEFAMSPGRCTARPDRVESFVIRRD